MTRQVAIIGAGRRVRHNFLPALAALGDAWELVGITSRRGHSAAEVGERWSVPAVPAMTALDWRRIDTVIVSVTTTQVPKVLRQLEPHAASLDLVVDTPVFARAADLRQAGRLRPFRRVIVAEDFMRFPQHDLLRAAVAAGAIGTPRHVTLARTGSLYHGLALARSVYGFPAVRQWRARTDGADRHVRYVLDGGGTVDVEAPYVPESGAVVVQGDAGTLRTGGTDADAPGSLTIERIDRGGCLSGFGVTTSVGRLELEPPVLARLHGLDLEDRREFNLAKTCGTAACLAQLEHYAAVPYGPPDAIYDTIVSVLAQKSPVAIDPLGVAARLAWRTLGRARAPILPGRASSLSGFAA